MSKSIRRASRSQERFRGDQHRFEHWLVDNQVYFITARCRGRFSAFASQAAKAIFWERFEHYARECTFTPWVTSLMDNHYHTIGYLRDGSLLTKMMQRIHGSVAKLVNDMLAERRTEFWRDGKGKEYFDGCIRNERQGRLAYRYILRQGQRHGLVADGCCYPHTRVNVELEVATKRAKELEAFLEGVPYRRYMRNVRRGDGDR